MHDETSDRRGSAVRWFALTAVVLCAASLAGTQGLEWLSRSGRIAYVTERPAVQVQTRRIAAQDGVDPTPTGAIPAQSALVIRIR